MDAGELTGNARYVPIANIVREVGRNVVIRLAALDASTARKSSRCTLLPSTGSASAPNTLSDISSLPSPARSCRRRRTSVSRSPPRQVSRIDAQSNAARPGIVNLSDSSFTVRLVSQPQNEDGAGQAGDEGRQRAPRG